MDVNLKIISDVKKFISAAISDSRLKEQFIATSSDFTRNRKLCFERLVGILLNFLKKSYSIEIAGFYDHIEAVEEVVSKSAFCQQRMKIKPLFFACLNEVLVKSYYRHYADKVKRWKGHRLIAVDSSTIYLTKTPDIIDLFGTFRNQSGEVAMGRLASAFDVLNGLTIWSDLYPVHVSERKVACHWLDHYEQDMVLLYDRGFPSFTTLFLHQAKEHPQPFIMRCPVDYTSEIISFVNSKRKDKISFFKANYSSYYELIKLGYIVAIGQEIPVRLIKVKLPNGTLEIIATNLFDKQQYPSEVFKAVYFKRWAIETSYDVLKNKLQLEAPSGQKLVTIMQDAHIVVFLSNLQQIIARSCEKELAKINRSRKHLYKININVALGLMKDKVIDIFLRHDPEAILHQLQHSFLLNLEPERPERTYKRWRKSCRPRGKYYTFFNYKRAI